jgi:ankyrin repeat protein
VRLLLSYNARGDAANSVGTTPLHLAAQGGHLDAAAVLLQEARVPADIRDRAGRTPLHFAAQEGHLELALLLKNAGANAGNASNVRAALLLSCSACAHKHTRLFIAVLR